VASQVQILVVVERLANDSDDELEQFRELARTQRVELRDAIVEEHLGLAKHLAGRFAYRGEPFDDLFQVACLALLKAVERFDPERSTKFNSFAVPYMVGELKRYFRDKGWSVRAPRRIQELYLEMSRQVEELTHQLGRPPTVAEIADAMNAPVAAVLEAMEAGRLYRSDSLDHPRDDNGNPPPVEQEGDEMDHADTRSILIEAVQGLSTKDQELIRMRFIDEMSQSAIARRLGVSQMQVSRLLAKSLQQLRAQFGDDDKRSVTA
jgi:RNA polymerase sigma-B factor